MQALGIMWSAPMTFLSASGHVLVSTCLAHADTDASHVTVHSTACMSCTQVHSCCEQKGQKGTSQSDTYTQQLPLGLLGLRAKPLPARSSLQQYCQLQQLAKQLSKGPPACLTAAPCVCRLFSWGCWGGAVEAALPCRWCCSCIDISIG